MIAVPTVIVAGTLLMPGAAAGLRLPPLELFLVYVPFFALQMVTTGLAEEPGWRDFALVRHQRQHGPLVGTLILSLLWAGWHAPLFLTEWGRGSAGQPAHRPAVLPPLRNAQRRHHLGLQQDAGEPAAGHRDPRVQQHLRVAAARRHVHHPRPSRDVLTGP
ncbi:CPBP family intramembrane glutamic endopeptidase [Rubrobacter tropicus]